MYNALGQDNACNIILRIIIQNSSQASMHGSRPAGLQKMSSTSVAAVKKGGTGSETRQKIGGGGGLTFHLTACSYNVTAIHTV